MISAFGVNHGEVSKAYANVARKMTFQLPKTGDTLHQRLSANYSQWRRQAGDVGQSVNAFKSSATHHARSGNAKSAKTAEEFVTQTRASGANRKVEARSQLQGIANINRRKPGTGIGRMEAAASAKLKPVPAKKKRWWKR